MQKMLSKALERYWLLLGIALLFLEWAILTTMKPFSEWNMPVLFMKVMYFSYALGSYYFITRLKVRGLTMMWGVFCMGLLFVVLSDVSVILMKDIFIMGTVSSIGVIVITLGIHYAGNEWGRKNKSLEKREHELEDALKKTASLEEVDRLKSQFLSMTSHELRTPITPIMMQIQMLLQERFGKLSDEQKKSMEMIFRETKRLDRLISDILDLSRLQMSGVRLDFRPNDLNQVMEHAVDSMKYGAQDKGVTLTLSGKRIPSFVFDRDRIMQVITDLISNAVKFTVEGGKVELDVTKNVDEVVVTVRDSGIGIEKSDIGRLFKPFCRIESSKTMNCGGVGLGLSICKGIVEQHSGRIWAESGGPGKGSAFMFALPFHTRKEKAPKKG